MSTILIGVDASERSEDAIAFGRRLADVAGAHVIVANAYPYSDMPSRASNAAYREALRDDALEIVRRMRDQLERVNDDDTQIRVTADPSPAEGAAPPGPRRAGVAGHRRLVAHRPRRPRAARQHRRAPAARRTVLGRRRAPGLPQSRRPADPPDRRRLQRHRRGACRRQRRRIAGARAAGRDRVIGIVATEYFTAPGADGRRGHRLAAH